MTPLPSTKHRLVGLALSGGGIRSATFNLGVLQALHHIGVLPYVDYLSTVSGGGYIGGALSALTHRPGSPFPFKLEQRTPEPPALNHLRGNANYLMLGGAFDGVRMAMVILRGILINLMLVMPWCIFLTVTTSLLYWSNLVDEDGDSIPLAIGHFFQFTRYLAPAYLAFLFLSPVITRLQSAQESAENPNSYRMRDLFERFVAYGVLLVGAVAFVEALPLGVGLVHLARTEQNTAAIAGAGSTLSVVGALLARQMGNAGASILERAGVVIASLLGPLLLIGIFVVLTEQLIYYNPDPYYLAETIWLGIGIAILTFNLLFINVNQHSGHRFWRDRLGKAFLIAPNGDQLEHVDALPLSQLAQPGSDAPYHLLNTTLNLQGDRDMVNRALWRFFCIQQTFCRRGSLRLCPHAGDGAGGPARQPGYGHGHFFGRRRPEHGHLHHVVSDAADDPAQHPHGGVVGAAPPTGRGSGVPRLAGPAETAGGWRNEYATLRFCMTMASPRALPLPRDAGHDAQRSPAGEPVRRWTP